MYTSFLSILFWVIIRKTDIKLSWTGLRAEWSVFNFLFRPCLLLCANPFRKDGFRPNGPWMSERGRFLSVLTEPFYSMHIVYNFRTFSTRTILKLEVPEPNNPQLEVLTWEITHIAMSHKHITTPNSRRKHYSNSLAHSQIFPILLHTFNCRIKSTEIRSKGAELFWGHLTCRTVLRSFDLYVIFHWFHTHTHIYICVFVWACNP